VAKLTKIYKIEIDGKQANATVGQLKTEIQRLEEELDNVTVGSAEADAAIRKLGNAKGALKQLEDAVDALDPKMKAAAFVDLANGVVGSFAVMTTAAETFGLSSTVAEDYRKKLDSLLVTMSGVEQISRALNSETLSVVKSTFAAAKGYLGMGEAASRSSKITRAALATTGIGVLVVLIGVLYANWDKVTASVKRNKDAVVESLRVIAPPLAFIIDQVSAFADKVGGLPQLFSGMAEVAVSRLSIIGDVFADLLRGDFSKAKADAGRLGEGIGEAFNKGVIAKNVELAKEQGEAALKLTIEANKRRIAELEAAGRDTYALSRKTLQQELSLLKQGSEEEKKVYADKLSEIRVLDNQHQVKLAEARKAAAAKVKAQQEKEFAEAKKRVEDLQQLEGLSYAELQQRQQAAADERAAAQAAEIDKLGKVQSEGVARVQEQLQREAAARAQAMAPPPFSDWLLTKVFGLTDSQLATVKGVLLPAIQELGTSLLNYAAESVATSLAANEEQLATIQQRLSEFDQQLAERSRAVDATEAALATAKGARRDYLIQKLNSERAAEEKIRQERAKAAKEEQQALKEKARLTKQQQDIEKLGAAITAANNVAKAVELGIDAARAIAEASSKGKVGFDNIALAIGATAALVTGILSVKSAAKKFEAGGVLPGGIIQGGSHASGNDVPVFGGRVRVEGGEGILPVDATRKNYAAFELLRTQGRRRTLTPQDFAALAQQTPRVLPTPAGVVQGRYADGGVLPTGQRTAAPAAPAANNSQALEAKLERNNALLERILGSSDATARNTAAIAAKPSGNGDRNEQVLFEEEARLNAAKRVVKDFGNL
jgi:hypothetical protein